MRNIDWLCENDRERLLDILTAETDCDMCAFSEDNSGYLGLCEYDCDDGVRKWMLAERNDGLKPENGVSAEGGDSNDGKPDIDASGRIPTEQAAENLAGNMKRLNGILGQSFSETYRNYHELGKLGEKPSVESCGGDADTREKLEADIHEFKRRHAQDKLELIAFESIACRWLDRQKAIAEREQAERIRKLEQVVQADKEDCAQSFADMKVMENQCDRLNKQVAELRGAVCERDKRIARLEDYLDIAKRYNESLHDRLGEAMSYAMKIEKQTEVG